MTEEVKEKAEIVAEIVENAIVENVETVEEVKADIIVERAEETVRRAEDAVNIIEQTAAIKVAEIALDAEIKVAEHAEKVEYIEGSLEWAHERINYLVDSMDTLSGKMEAMASKQLTQAPLTQTEIPQTVEVEVNQSEVVDDLQNPIAELEQQIIPQQKRKYRAL